jgi:hypothetical protein
LLLVAVVVLVLAAVAVQAVCLVEILRICPPVAILYQLAVAAVRALTQDLASHKMVDIKEVHRRLMA